jgi:hypothetical protein
LRPVPTDFDLLSLGEDVGSGCVIPAEVALALSLEGGRAALLDLEVYVGRVSSRGVGGAGGNQAVT